MNAPWSCIVKAITWRTLKRFEVCRNTDKERWKHGKIRPLLDEFFCFKGEKENEIIR